MWIGTTNGVSKYDGISFTNYTDSEGLCGNFIRNFIQDKEGKIWIASDKSGLSVFDGKSFLNYSRKEGLIDNSIYFFFRDKNDDIWLGAGSTHLLKFDGVSFLHYPLSGGSGNNYVRTIIRDDKGNMWIGTEEEGLLVFDGNTFTHFTDKEGLSSNLIRCSLKDNNGKLWFGTRGGGITRYDGDLFTHLSKEEGLSNNRVMAILEDQPDQFWIGTYGGYVTRSTYRETNGLKKRFFSYYNEKDGLPNGRIYTITRDKNNNIWFGTDGGGISVFNGKSMATYTSGEGLCGDAVRKIIQDRKGNLWIASHNSGISKFDGNTFVNYTVKQGLSSDYVLSIMEDKEGNLWMGTTNAGITMFDGKKFTHFTEDNGFFNNMVYCIMQDKNGIIWFGTGGGAISYDGKFFTRYRNINGNDFVNVLSILQDSRDNIWFGTRSGLFILKEGKTENPQFRRFNYEDGFGGIGCNMGAITESEDGTIWIGTTDRLTAYHREGDKSNQRSISVQLTGVNLFNETIPWGDIFGKNDTIITLSNGVPISGFRFRDISPWNNIPVDLNLRHNNNYLTFNYVAVSITGNSKIRYQYKLDGYEGDWSIPTETTEVSFGNLNPGSYIFRVRAIDRDGISSDEVSYPFIIRPPWYKTIAFRILLVTAIIVLILSYIQYRLRKLQRDKEILQQKVDEQTSEITRNNLILTRQKNEILEKNIAIEKTNEELLKINSEKDKFFSIIAHDLRGPFSGLMMLTEEMTAQINELDKEEIKEMLKAMQTSSTNLFRLLENLLNWARMKRGKIPFEPDNYSLNQVVNESLSLMMDQALAKKIEIELRIPSDIFVFADKNMLQTIIRNLVSNAIKFTHTSGRVFLSADRYETGLIVISVKDTGIGMSSDLASRIFRIDEKINRSGTEGEISTGLGLLLCKEFVEKHGGAIWVDSVEGKGSEFRFSIQEGRTK
jgi:signal transduction histidine kinase/ligand-binding sensor domain-containing protein